MPFDFVQYQQKVNTLSTEQLHKEWENYTRQIAGGATSTATSVLFSPVTGGVSLIGLGLSAPRIHNARKKREIIEAGLQARGATHNTRKRDVVAPMAVAGAISGLTLGLAGPGAEMIGGEVGAKGVEYVVAHAALDGTGAILEQKHDDHTKKKAEHKLYQQHQNFQKQQAGMMGQQQAIQIPQGMYQIQGVSAPPGMVAMALQPGYQLVQDPKLGYVPVPIPVSTPSTPVPQYNTVSYQQAGPSMTPVQQAPQYQQVQQTFQQPPQPQNGAYPPEKQGETYPVQTKSQQGFPPPFSEPLPVYSPSSTNAVPSPSQNEKPQSPAAQTPQIMVNELPTEIQIVQSPESAMEQEIALLKARLLQMELEKRNIAVEPPPVLQQVTIETAQSQATSRTPPPQSGGLGCSDHQAYMPSPTPTPHPVQVSQHLPPPPQSATFQPSPMSTPPPQYDASLQNQPSSTASSQQKIPSPPPQNQQQFAQQQIPSPPPQNPQQQIYVNTKPPHPDFQRHDSGYYSQPPSQAPSRTQSVTSLPLYTLNPQHLNNQPQLLSPISPQSTGQSSVYNPSQHRHSISQTIYTPLPSTPASSMYFPPPPGTTNIPPISPVGKQDYFGNVNSVPTPRIGTPQPPVYRSDMYQQQPNLPQGGYQVQDGQLPVQQGVPQQQNGNLMQPQMMYSQPQQQSQQIQGTQGWQWGNAQQPQQFVGQPMQMQGQQSQQQVSVPTGYPMR